MNIKKKNGEFFRNEAGVSAVEFALILVPLLLLIVGIIEFGRALQIRNEVERSLDIAAREFEINGFRGSFLEGVSSCSGSQNNLETRFLEELRTGTRPAIVPDQDNLSVSVECTDNEYIRVEARYEFTLLIPFVDINLLRLSIGRLVQGPW